MGSGYRTLEITVLSGEDLRIDRRNVKKNTYVLVRTDNLNSRTTKMDTEGGSYPLWNQKLIIDMPLRETFVTIEVHCKTAASSGDRIIGSTRMPIQDCTGGYIPENYLSFLSYRLMDPIGRKNGIINLSVKVRSPEYSSDQWPQKTCSAAPVIPIVNRDNNNFGIVTGVPVWSSKVDKTTISS